MPLKRLASTWVWICLGATAGAATFVGGPRWTHHRDQLLFSSDVEAPLRQFAGVAIETRKRLRRVWGRRETGRFPENLTRFYFCRDEASLADVERQHRYRRSSASSAGAGAARGARASMSRGGYYHRQGIAALIVAANEDARRDVSHELSHAVLREHVGSIVDLVNEGLATVVPPWILYTRDRLPGSTGIIDLNYARTIARAEAEGAVPALEELFRMGYWDFRAEPASRLHFALGWSFVDFLLGTEDPQFAGRFAEFLDRSVEARSSLKALRSVYGLEALEVAWRERHAAFADLLWEPVYGKWFQVGDRLVGSVRTPGSAVMLRRDRLEPPFRLAFRLERELGERQGAGFVLGQGENGYLVVQAGAGGREIVAHHLDGGHWRGRRKRTLTRPLDLQGKGLELVCDAEGRIEVRCGDRPIFLHGVDQAAIRGRVGLMVELFPGAEFSQGDVLFGEVEMAPLRR